ncbi:MAG TPA: hypothetical protein VFE42_12170 [Chloroflexota bacterium]|nr:hypothetical protein [Chloroflexota bacterium]
MAATLPIHLDLPAELYARIEEAAARSNQPIESILVESLTLLFGTTTVSADRLWEMLETLTDTQLWALVYRQSVWSAHDRLQELRERGREAPLSDEEQAELAALIDEADRQMLLRSQALYLLQQRGHRVQDLIQRGA